MVDVDSDIKIVFVVTMARCPLEDFRHHLRVFETTRADTVIPPIPRVLRIAVDIILVINKHNRVVLRNHLKDPLGNEE